MATSDADAGRAAAVPPTIGERESIAATKRPASHVHPSAVADPASAVSRRRLSRKQPVDRPELGVRPTPYRGREIYHSQTGRKCRIYNTIGGEAEGATRIYIPGDSEPMQQAWADDCLRLESIRRRSVDRPSDITFRLAPAQTSRVHRSSTIDQRASTIEGRFCAHIARGVVSSQMGSCTRAAPLASAQNPESARGRRIAGHARRWHFKSADQSDCNTNTDNEPIPSYPLWLRFSACRLATRIDPTIARREQLSAPILAHRSLASQAIAMKKTARVEYASPAKRGKAPGGRARRRLLTRNRTRAIVPSASAISPSVGRPTRWYGVSNASDRWVGQQLGTSSTNAMSNACWKSRWIGRKSLT